ncbi:MAG: flagellar motor protein MotB [Negativicutes bacterium]|nr:flagellar motor protein MotB [Negativicutes bacterium]
MAKSKLPSEPHEEHADETWLIPYADLLTLLLALFIVLFASAQVDQKKFEALAESFSNAFRGSTSIFESTRTPPKITPAQQNELEKSQSALTNPDKASAIQQESIQFAEIKRQLDAYIKEKNLSGSLEALVVEDGLMIRIRDSALFPSGSAELYPDSRVLAAEIAKILGALSQNVLISGHTDSVPINTYEFPTNWDLSAKRALNFMKFVLAQDRTLKPERFSAIGHGEYRPIAANDSETNRSKNRRVEVLIVRTYKQ